MRAAHALFGAASALVLWRALSQGWVDADLPPEAVATIRLGIPLLSLYASTLASATRRYRDDALSVGALFLLVSVLATGPLTRDAAGLFFVGIIALRFGPPVLALVRTGNKSLQPQVLKAHAPILDEMGEFVRCHAGNISEPRSRCAPNSSEDFFPTSDGWLDD